MKINPIKLVLSIILTLTISNKALTQTKIACIGNSITFGYGLSSPSTQSYPSQLQILTGNNFSVYNFGVSARTLLKKGDRPYWNESEYTSSKILKPETVIIKLGTNDAKLQTNWTPHKDEFIPDYKDLINSYESLTSAPEIYICMLVPAYKEIWEISDATIKNEVNPDIKKVALDKGVNLIDCYTPMVGKSNLFASDGIHPNVNGAKELANIIYSAISKSKPVIEITDSILTAPEASNYQWYKNGIAMTVQQDGNNKSIKNPTNGTYKVSIQLTNDNYSRMVSEEVKITAKNLLIDLKTTNDIGFNNFSPEKFSYNINLEANIPNIQFIALADTQATVLINNTLLLNNTTETIAINSGTTKNITFSVYYPEKDTTHYSIKVTREELTEIRKTYRNKNSLPFPNPGIDEVTFNLKNTKEVVKNITLYNTDGKVVFSKHLHNEKYLNALKINCSCFTPGIYLYSIQQEQSVINGKLVIQNN